MRGCLTGGARRAHAKAISLFVAVAAAPALLVGQSVVAAAAPASRAPAAREVALRPMTAALAAQLSKNVNRHVIVILKSQLAAAHVGTRSAALRSDAIAAYQAPLLSELREVRATHVKSFQLVDSLAATVSAGEEARLKADPAVAEVIPDVTIEGARACGCRHCDEVVEAGGRRRGRGRPTSARR